MSRTCWLLSRSAAALSQEGSADLAEFRSLGLAASSGHKGSSLPVVSLRQQPGQPKQKQRNHCASHSGSRYVTHGATPTGCAGMELGRTLSLARALRRLRAWTSTSPLSTDARGSVPPNHDERSPVVRMCLREPASPSSPDAAPFRGASERIVTIEADHQRACRCIIDTPQAKRPSIERLRGRTRAQSVHASPSRHAAHSGLSTPIASTSSVPYRFIVLRGLRRRSDAVLIGREPKCPIFGLACARRVAAPSQTSARTPPPRALLLPSNGEASSLRRAERELLELAPPTSLGAPRNAGCRMRRSLAARLRGLRAFESLTCDNSTAISPTSALAPEQRSEVSCHLAHGAR